MQESDEELTLSTTAATARVSLNPLRIGFADPSGRSSPSTTKSSGWAPSRPLGPTSSRNPG